MSLMQADRKLLGVDSNVPIRFTVTAVKKSYKGRLWHEDPSEVRRARVWVCGCGRRRRAFGGPPHQEGCSSTRAALLVCVYVRVCALPAAFPLCLLPYVGRMGVCF